MRDHFNNYYKNAIFKPITLIITLNNNNILLLKNEYIDLLRPLLVNWPNLIINVLDINFNNIILKLINKVIIGIRSKNEKMCETKQMRQLMEIYELKKNN